MCNYSYNFNQWQFTNGVGPLLIKHLPQRMADTGVCTFAVRHLYIKIKLVRKVYSTYIQSILDSQRDVLTHLSSFQRTIAENLYDELARHVFKTDEHGICATRHGRACRHVKLIPGLYGVDRDPV